MADGTPQTDAPDTLARIARATGEIGTQQYDSANKHDGYSYLSEQRVKELARAAIAKHGIAPSNTRFDVISDAWIEAKNGGQFNLIKLRCVLEWPDGSACEGLGAGRDYGDKALMKAQTSSFREAWKNRLTIASGDDPEQPGEIDNDRATGKPAESERPREQRQQQSRPASSGRPVIIPFGRTKGRDITDPSVTVADLEYVAKAVTASIRDPQKAQYKARNQELLEALQREILARNNNQHCIDDASVDDRDDPGFADDNIPF